MLMYSAYFCWCTCHQSSCSSSSNLITQILLASEAIEISRLPAYAYFIIHITLNFKSDETVSALQYIASDQVILKWRQSWLEQSCQHLNKFWFSMLIGRGRGKGIIDDNWAKSFDHICNLGVNFFWFCGGHFKMATKKMLLASKAQFALKRNSTT